jgi:hypothetical protein
MQNDLKKQQVCFFHVPKVAGNTVLELLRTHFGQENVFHSTDSRHLTKPIAQLFRIHPIVAGHFSARYLSNDVLTKTFIFTFLRNPLERILSQYSYYRSLPASAGRDDPAIQFAQNAELDEIFKEDARSGTFSPWSNLQTAIFSGCNLTHPVNHDLFEQAKHNLEQLDFVGILEDFANGIQELFARMGQKTPQEIPFLNRTINRIQIDSLDPGTANLIAESNQLDQALFLHAKKLWRERHVPSSERSIFTDLTRRSEHGTLEIEVTSISFKGLEPSCRKLVQGRPWSLLIRARSSIACADLTFGILITDESGATAYGTNSWLKGNRWTASANKTFTVEIQFPTMTLAKGQYDITVSFHTGRDTTQKCFHWLENAFHFEVIEEGCQDFVGTIDLGARFELIDSG